MKKFISIAAIAVSLVGCGTTNQSAQPNSAKMAQTPNLKIVIDCGTCRVRENVSALIVEGYREAAGKSGVSISSTSEATVTIQEYSDRNDAARVLAGAFAGKDEIRTVVTYQDRKFGVEDYYRNAWLGIESLAKKIGGMVFTQIQ